MLGLVGDERPLTWYGLPYGILILTARGQQQTHNLYMIDKAALVFASAAQGRLLGPVPPLQDWVSAPAQGVGGLMFAAAGGRSARLYRAAGLVPDTMLTDLPSPGRGEIAALSAAGDGRFVLALRHAEGLRLVSGFGLGAWQEGPWLPIDAGAEAGIAMGPIGGGGFWLMDGQRVLAWPDDNICTPPPFSLTLPDGMPMPAGLRAQLARNPLAPMAIRAEGSRDGAAHLFMPVQGLEGIGLASISLVDGATPTVLGRTSSPGPFLVPDPVTGGAVLCDGEQVRCLRPNGDVAWSLAGHEGQVAPPLCLDGHVVTLSLVSHVSAVMQGKETSLTVWKRGKDGAPLEPQLQRRLDGKARMVLPPLIMGDRLVYATSTKEGTQVRVADLLATHGTGGIA